MPRAMRRLLETHEDKVRLALTALAVALALLLCRRPLQRLWRPDAPGAAEATVDPRPVAPSGKLLPDELATIALFDKASPSVVALSSGPRDTRGADRPDRPDGSRRRREDEQAASGSGFVWDRQGHVVTNYHVVRRICDPDDMTCQIRFKDGRAFAATVVGTARDKDLAVLKVEAPADSLVPILVGRSAELRIGQNAYAIGNPFGLDLTLTKGIVSATGRELYAGSYDQWISDVIQTTAAINPGNSGGPLLDSSGRLVGVTTAVAGDGAVRAQNISFAIPVDQVNQIVPQIIRYGGLRPLLGIEVLDPRVARRLFEREEGVVIGRVRDDSSAAKAGLHGLTERFDPDGSPASAPVLGDVILSLAGEAVRSGADVVRVLQKYRPGDAIEVVIERDGDVLQRTVELEDAL